MEGDASDSATIYLKDAERISVVQSESEASLMFPDFGISYTTNEQNSLDLVGGTEPLIFQR